VEEISVLDFRMPIKRGGMGAPQNSLVQFAFLADRGHDTLIQVKYDT